MIRCERWLVGGAEAESSSRDGELATRPKVDAWQVIEFARK